MKKAKTGIHIVDATRTVQDKHPQFPNAKHRVPAYRVKSVGKNGETLETSEVLNTVAAVQKHIASMEGCWNGEAHLDTIKDCTKSRVFYKKNIAGQQSSEIPFITVPKTGKKK
jgi:hypothetical protein